MVSHDVEFCARYADQVSMFFDGQVLTTDTPRRFFGANSFSDLLDKIDVIQEIAKADLGDICSQYFAVLTNARSVGVMGDGRTYENVLALRSVTTSDFMTAEWTRIPYEMLDRASVRIVNEVPHINRIVYDITSKPPATVEWE